METKINLTTNKEFSEYKFINGYIGSFGGSFVPPVLKEKLEKLTEEFNLAISDQIFLNELSYYFKQYVGRPSPLYFAKNISEENNCKIYLKREDLNHTGSHKINNTIGQILLAKRMGATEIIAETGAGQHGVATATAAALFGMKCKIFQGKTDAERQSMNVKRIQILGAELIITEKGTATLKDAVDAALEYYIQNPNSYYLLGSQVGPHPYPQMVEFFQQIIGIEAKQQFLEAEGCLPDHLIACIGGGSNAIGLFKAFLDDTSVQIHAAEGGGLGYILGQTSATLCMGKPAVFQGTYSYCLLDDEGNPVDAHSIAAGLDYPGVSPMHSYLKDTGRAQYYLITDKEAVESMYYLSKMEGIIPAIESSHAITLALKILTGTNESCIINLSGRGDKDVLRDDI